jgi:hypothetical protein
LGSRFATMSTDRYRHLREGHQESDHEQRKSQRPRQPPDKSRESNQDEAHNSEYPPLVYQGEKDAHAGSLGAMRRIPVLEGGRTPVKCLMGLRTPP